MTAGLIHRPGPAGSRSGWSDPARQMCSESESSSEQFAIDDKSGVLRDLVIKLHRGEVRLVCLPVYARRSGKLRLLIDSIDQCSAHTFSARGLAGEQILQIAGGFDGRGAPVEEVVRQAKQFSAALSDKAMYRLICIEEARSGHPRNFIGRRRRAGPPVKRVVSMPQRKPLVVVLPGHKADR